MITESDHITASHLQPLNETRTHRHTGRPCLDGINLIDETETRKGDAIDLAIDFAIDFAIDLAKSISHSIGRKRPRRLDGIEKPSTCGGGVTESGSAEARGRQF